LFFPLVVRAPARAEYTTAVPGSGA